VGIVVAKINSLPYAKKMFGCSGASRHQMGHAPSPALATEAATRDGSALDAYSGRAHARAEVRSRHSQILVWAL
jgi:hypothetical protein